MVAPRKVLITGGCGYVGTRLVDEIIKVTSWDILICDTLWFGDYTRKSNRIKILKKSVSELIQSDLDDVDSVVHLAGIPNDASAMLNPALSWEVNVLHTAHLMRLCEKSSSVKRIAFASSGSVYGVSDEERVTESVDLFPISTYNKTKMAGERVVLSYQDKFKIYIVRPATVCGLSRRMRFDVTVNMFVAQAFTDRKIRVLGGSQIRPNIHIDDMVQVYLHLLREESNIEAGIYNAGFENLTVKAIADQVSMMTEKKVVYEKSNDPRSYRLDSTKLLKTGFIPQRKVVDAMEEIWGNLQAGNLQIEDNNYSVKWLKDKIDSLQEFTYPI